MTSATPAWGPDFAALEAVDPDIARILLDERDRLNDGLQLIASENFTSPAVLAALGSTLSNKYAEGYPGRRYYGGCEVVDQAETLGIERAKALFGADHANLQPHSGASANIAAYGAFVQPGEMGAVGGACLVGAGHTVRWASAGRCCAPCCVRSCSCPLLRHELLRRQQEWATTHSARGVGDHGETRVVLLVVHAHHKHGGILGGRGDDDLRARAAGGGG